MASNVLFSQAESLRNLIKCLKTWRCPEPGSIIVNWHPSTRNTGLPVYFWFTNNFSLLLLVTNSKLTYFFVGYVSIFHFEMFNRILSCLYLHICCILTWFYVLNIKTKYTKLYTPFTHTHKITVRYLFSIIQKMYNQFWEVWCSLKNVIVLINAVASVNESSCITENNYCNEIF